MSNLNRRQFLGALAALLVSGCAAKVEKDEPDPDRDFHAWLKKKKRYRQFNTLDEAREAYESEIEKANKEAEWKAYRKKHNLR